MCLLAIAHRVPAGFPLVIAANRDEDYERPTLPAGFWADRSGVIGGRDALHGGSWLALDGRGRFAAVTNLRASAGVIGKRSRGRLVHDFVAGESTPGDYVEQIDGCKDEYAGFHLVAGVAGADLAPLSGSSALLPPGIYAWSNADPGVRWPKVDAAENEMTRLVKTEDADELCAALMSFLTGGRVPELPDLKRPEQRVEVTDAEERRDTSTDIFVAGQRYGTRSSTVIIVDRRGQARFVEQAFGRGGKVLGEPRVVRFRVTSPAG